MIFYKGKCVEGSTVIDSKPIDGGWSEFGDFTACSRTCGGGVRYRERSCNNPPLVTAVPCIQHYIAV